MANNRVFFSDLKSGRCSSAVEVMLLRFWEARNVRHGGELMWVDMLMIDVKLISGSDDATVHVWDLVAKNTEKKCLAILDKHFSAVSSIALSQDGWTLLSAGPTGRDKWWEAFIRCLIALYLPRSVFSHDQLYVALSRVTSPEGLKILDDTTTDPESADGVTNIVYKEIFHNLPDIKGKRPLSD